MKRLLLILSLIALLATSCSLKAHAASSDSVNSDNIRATATAAAGTAPTEITTQAAASSTVTAPGSAAAISPTEKTKGKKSDPNAAQGGKGGGGKGPQIVPTSAEPAYIAAPITGRPTNNSITINVVPAAGMTVSAGYGTSSGQYNYHTAEMTLTAGQPEEIEINNLSADTTYYYSVISNGVNGIERSFHTQRSTGSSFTFEIQGDSHPERTGKQFDAALYTKTLAGAAGDKPDFYMAIGDDFSVDQMKTVNAQTVTSLYVNQRQWLGSVGAPVFLVNGNHEQASMANLNGSAENVAVWAQNARNMYFPQPAPDAFYSGDSEQVQFIGQLRDYYAYTWGDALFVVIDPYWHSAQTVDNQFGADRSQKQNRDLWNVTLGDTQYRWFRQTLEGSSAKYKFVFTHHVLGTGRGGIEFAKGYEWGDAAGLAAHRPGWDKTIQQVMADTNVTIFFQGHDHIFARQDLDGVIYQTLPEPANPFYSWENSDSYLSGDKFPNSGRVRVDVAESGVTVSYIRSYLEKADETAFSYTVK